MHESEKITTV